MAEFKGSIELIDGIKPKNNGDFPLVSARDVQVDKSGRRLDEKLAIINCDNYVTAYEAKGDGTTDDTKAFQDALAAERIVYVPGGTYKLSAGLVIGDNCELELAQDAVLVFTQTEGNCITLEMLSSLKGNHATIKVPYEFAGNVIYASTATVLTPQDRRDVEPFQQWDPQWKSGRYITDINICKADCRNFHYLVAYEDKTYDKCKGTAMYFSADANSHQTFMWGVTCSGIRIAGAFEYGIRGQNFAKTGDPDYIGWNHEMRIEAIIDACETGVSLEDCHCAFMSVTFQPRGALIYGRDGDKKEDYVPYAKHGIKLIRSKNIDLGGSRVWDWNTTNTLYRPDNEYKFLAMYGECRGAIVNAFQYYEEGTDIRKLIYTDTPSNLEQINILQEPFDRWFKNRDDVPYFSDGLVEKRLVTGDEMDAIFDAKSMIPRFKNQLPIATDASGAIYNGKGYKDQTAINGEPPANEVTGSDRYWCSLTGFIPVKSGSVIRVKNMLWEKADPTAERVVFFDADKNVLTNPSGTYSVFVQSTKLDENKAVIPTFTTLPDGFEMTLGSIEGVAYTRFGFMTKHIGDDPIITVDEEIAYSMVGALSDNVKVKAENVIGLPSGGGVDVTAEVGQTIVVKEVDASGKPTKWEAADYQPRTHYPTIVDHDIVPLMTFETAFDSMFQAFAHDFETPFELVEGKEYNVTYDGVEYTQSAFSGSFQGVPFVAIGNAVLAGLENTGEPFCVVVIGGMSCTCFCMTDTAETEHSIHVTEKGPGYKTIDEHYLPSYTKPYILKIPDGAAKTTDFYTYYVDSISYDDFAEHVYNGGEIILDLSNKDAIRLLKPVFSGYAIYSWSFYIIEGTQKDEATNLQVPKIKTYIFMKGNWRPPTA